MNLREEIESLPIPSEQEVKHIIVTEKEDIEALCNRYADERMENLAEKVKVKYQLSLMTNVGESHEDFGKTDRTKHLDKVVDQALAELKEEM